MWDAVIGKSCERRGLPRKELDRRHGSFFGNHSWNGFGDGGEDFGADAADFFGYAAAFLLHAAVFFAFGALGGPWAECPDSSHCSGLSAHICW